MRSSSLHAFGLQPAARAWAAPTCVAIVLVEQCMIGRVSRRMDAVLLGTARRSPAKGMSKF